MKMVQNWVLIISTEDLPTGTEAYRFEFGVTYIQADENAYLPETAVLPEIPTAFEYNNSDGIFYRLNSNRTRVGNSGSTLGTVFTNETDIPSSSDVPGESLDDNTRFYHHKRLYNGKRLYNDK